MFALVISQGQYAILATLVTGFFAILAALVSVRRTAKRTEGIVTTVEVNTNRRLTEALDEVKALRETVTHLVEALAVAQESPAQDRKPVPVVVIDPAAPEK